MQTLPQLSDTDRALVRRLAGVCAGFTTTEVINRFYADGEVAAALARRAGVLAPPPEVHDRYAFMSGIVVAEVALHRAGRLCA